MDEPYVSRHNAQPTSFFLFLRGKGFSCQHSLSDNKQSLSFVTVSQVKEIEIAVDEKELQKEAALKEKEKELQALRVQLESLSQNLQERNSEASRTGQEQASKVSNLLAELQNISVEKKGKC